MNPIQPIFPLEGIVQHYAWGGYEFIPKLLGLSNTSHEPYAELWMGAHPKGPSLAVTRTEKRVLNELIADAPAAYLGQAISGRFDQRLPFLFKILDVRSMLSIQAHPNKRQAEAGYQKENLLGIPLESPQRIFRDDNHKPEVMVALTDFWLLHGFRSLSEIEVLSSTVPEFAPLASVFQAGDLKSIYQHLMTIPQAEVNDLLYPLERRLRQEKKAGRLSESQAEYWAAQAFEEYTTADGDVDRGIFSIFLLNLVHIPRGSGIYQGAGIPHAYLRGVNVELMANSDNVFRGGLTPKHVDVEALMSHLEFRSVHPRIISGESGKQGLTLFPTPAPDFELARIDVQGGRPFHSGPHEDPQILIVMEGRITLNRAFHFEQGNIFFICPGTAYAIEAGATASLFRAGVPQPVK